MRRAAFAVVAFAALVARGVTPLVEVTFDPAGGELADDLRVVQAGGTYGQNVNIYPSDSPSNFSSLPSDRISLENGVFTYSSSVRWCNYWSKPIGNIVEGKPYTYVIDVLTYANTASQAPWFNVGQTGGDQPSQLTGTYRQVQGVGRLVFNLSGQEQSGRTTLGRDFIDLNPADGTCSMTFRVQLYAGKSAVPPDGVYAASGECVAMPLPVPVRAGFTFAGWKSAAGELVTAETEVTESENHTLVAVWKRNPGVVVPVKVTFDAAGGQVKEKFRIVNTEQTFGRTVNLYPSDSTEHFHGFQSDRISLADNVFTVDAKKDDWVNLFSRNIKAVEIGESYTYVIDVLSVEEGDLGYLSIGRTGGYWAGGQQIQLASAGVQIGSTAGIHAVPVVGADYEEGFTTFNYLSRDYFHPPADTRASFRISLFAGSMVNASNYSYVAPGEGMPLALPVATKAGRAFDCWIDADGNRILDETIVDVDGDVTLTAQWKPWTVSIENGDRPRVGTQLVASTNYGDGSRESEDGVVSYKWFRGDWKGEYESAAISTDAAYIPSAGDLEHFLKAVVYVDGVETLSSALWLSKLPVVYIDTYDGADIVVKSDEKTSNVRIQGNAEFGEQYNGVAFVKGRGNSTWGLPKKPYKVKLDKKTNLFKFGSNKHWVLLANYIDVSSMRNKTAYDMSGAFGLEYMDSTWVEVVFNGRFDGMYQLCEHVRVDKTRVNVFNWEDAVDDEKDLSSVDPAATDITGGYLWELSDEYDEVSKFKIDVTGDGETGEDIPVMFNRPEFACTNPAMMNWCSNFWHDVYATWTSPRNETAGGTKSWKDLCDIDSMVSYWLVNEIFGNDDAWYKSRYCYKDIGGKLTFGPVWDCDWGLGSVAVGTNDVARWRLAQNNNSGWPVSFYKEWLDDPWFCLRAWEKYQAMRPHFAALFEGENCKYDEYAAYLREAGLVEDARWGAERAQHYGDRARTVATDTAMFKEWMTTRLAWLDTVFETPESLMRAIVNHASAHPYIPYCRPDAIGASVKGQALARSDLGLAATAAEGTASVDVLVNGRFIAQFAADNLGTITVPKADWYEHGHKTLVELIGYGADGNVTACNHLILDPVGVGCWEDVVAETANEEIVPAAQAARLDMLGVKASKVAAWALARKVAFDPEQPINIEAFALDCAPTASGIASEKSAFVLAISIDADGTPRVSLPEGKAYNVEPVIEGRRSLTDGDGWHAPWILGEDRFFRGVINLQ